MKPTPSIGNKIPLQASTTVGSCITVKAGLLPREPAAMLFGGWVADNYAVVETTLSNHCDSQQFILHNIYLDYSDWALSGVYKGATSDTVCPPTAQPAATGSSKPAQAVTDAQPTSGADSSSPSPGSNCTQFNQHSEGGQVPTIGAKMVHDQLAEASVFSKRNLVVNGLVLVGTVAGGYAFVGSTAAAQGVGAYNSSFIPGLQKFWPDRRIQQQTNVLTYGYRTDQSTAIAKDDHGAYFAFFPISSFLIKQDLKPLFLSDPAVFMNPGEVLPDISGSHSGSDGSGKFSKGKKGRLYSGLRDYLLELTNTAVNALRGSTEQLSKDENTRRAFSLKLQYELGMPCNFKKDTNGALEDPGPQCPFDKTKVEDLARISTEKYLFAHASLNIVKIYVEGVMTVEISSIPPTIDTVTFDGKADEASYWTVAPEAKAAAPAAPAAPKPAAKPAAKPTVGAGDEAATAATTPDTARATANEKTGVIAGRYLTDGAVTITAITVPGTPNAKLTDYIVDKSWKSVSDKATDSSLPFTLQLAKTVPPGATIAFQVTHSTGDATKGTSSQTTSNKFVYTVKYAPTPADPTVTKVTIDGDDKTGVWQAKAKLTGTATGTNLDGGTIAVSALEIDGKPATVSEFIGPLAEVPKSSLDTMLDFQFQLLQKIADGSTVSFVVSKKVGETTVKSAPRNYIVKNPVTPAKKPAPVVKGTSSKPGKPTDKPSK